ncbi:hypothetical protein I4U23_027588 [Adineta vaga]|nr:hypothetical protein I4U23_027588 [Adineta vaga]
MHVYQSRRRSLTLTPTSDRWANKIAHLNAQQQYLKNAVESTTAPPFYSRLLLTGMVLAAMAMSIYTLIYVQKLTTIGRGSPVPSLYRTV